MEKLELKHIVGYLPYDLKGLIFYPNSDNETCTLKIKNGFNNECDINEFINGTYQIKPLLRTLSDLTKEIEVNSEKFVPIVELFKIGINVKDITVKNARFEFKDNAYQLTVSDNKNKDIVFAFDLNDNSFGTFYHNVTYSVFNQFQLFQKLYEWHFDLHSLIGKGLAIDLNTLK